MESPRGLTSDEVHVRQNTGLVNEIDEKSSRSFAHIVRSNVFTRFNAILGALFIIVVATGSLGDGLFGLVLVANTILGVSQEWKAKRTLDKIRFLHAPTAQVIRDGNMTEISLAEIVRDDIVSLRAGDQVPVDGYVLVSHNLEINEANLTGEADAVPKETSDVVFSGTFVAAGDGYIRATGVGKEAYAQRLAREAKIFTPTSSEMMDSINRILRWTLWSIILLAPLQIWSQVRVEEIDNWRDAVVRSVAGLVGVIPEGLVVLTTLTFLTAAVQLTRQQVLVQQLPAVETLARVNVLCIDKTGTLTTGKMTCTEVKFVDGNNASMPRQDIAETALSHLADDPAANATLRAIAQRFPSQQPLDEVAAIPFDSKRKWKASEIVGAGSWFLGAPEMLLPADTHLQEHVQKRAESGQRVLLLAHSQMSLTNDEVPRDIAPVAVIAIEEEIRTDVADTIAFFHKQGVEVFVLSGDHPATVKAIAQKIGIKKENVHGRVTPEQKRHLISQFHARGDVVAMTGDGVNDVLALKTADIGIAMDNAAPATKSVAELILLDGKFSHLPSVIQEGRRVIGNVERVAHVFLTKNVMSVVSILSVAILARQFPFLPRQMTFVSSVGIGIPAFFLAIGTTSPRYTPGLLGRVLRFSVPAGIVVGASVIATDYVVEPSNGTAASIVALIAFLWIISIFARPVTVARLSLLAAMGLASCVVFFVPVFSDFLVLSPHSNHIIPGIVGGICAGSAIEILHRLRK